MRFSILAPIIVLLGAAACSAGQDSSALTISGPAPEVERFVQTQTSLHPGLTVSETTTPAPGQSRVTLAVSSPATSEDVAEVSKQAITARLGVAFTSGG